MKYPSMDSPLERFFHTPAIILQNLARYAFGHGGSEEFPWVEKQDHSFGRPAATE